MEGVGFSYIRQVRPPSLPFTKLFFVHFFIGGDTSLSYLTKSQSFYCLQSYRIQIRPPALGLFRRIRLRYTRTHEHVLAVQQHTLLLS